MISSTKSSDDKATRTSSMATSPSSRKLARLASIGLKSQSDSFKDIELSGNDTHAFELPNDSKDTPLYKALAADQRRPVNRFDKLVKRTKRKAPIKVDAEYKGEEPYRPPGKLISSENDMYVMTIGMMVGLRYAVVLSLKKFRDNEFTFPKQSMDFSEDEKYTFPPSGLMRNGKLTTPKHFLAHTFKFKDYAPMTFHHIRLMGGIDSEAYMASVCGEVNFIQFVSNSKSGQFFFFTKDGAYMIKTISQHECKELRRVLPEYYSFLNPTLIRSLCEYWDAIESRCTTSIAQFTSSS